MNPEGCSVWLKWRKQRSQTSTKSGQAQGAAPVSVNHVRSKLRTIFFKARKAGLGTGANPITETEPWRVPKRVYPTAKIEETAGAGAGRQALVGISPGRPPRQGFASCRNDWTRPGRRFHGAAGFGGFSASFAAPLLTVREVAAFLRVSTRTVYAMCAEGRLGHVRVMNAIRLEAAALVALLRAK